MTSSHFKSVSGAATKEGSSPTNKRVTTDSSHTTSSTNISPTNKPVPTLGAESELQLLEVIGRGGNGDVYKGLAPDSDGVKRTVAVKIISSKAFSQSAKKEKAFKNAMSHLLSVDHPNILKLDSIYDCAGKTAVVSELCRGTDVVKLIQTHEPGTVDPALCCRIFRDIISGLAYLHSLRIIHCDIKLDNVKFREANMATSPSVILDLDSCLVEEDVQMVKEESNRIARGTFQYMPPEAFKGHYSYGGDIWSAGVTLFCLVDGHFPFKIRQGAHVDELILAVSMPPRFKPHIWNRLPGAEATVRAMLNVNPRRRPQAVDILTHAWLGPSSCPPQPAGSRKTAPHYSRPPPLICDEALLPRRPATTSTSLKSPLSWSRCNHSADLRNCLNSPFKESANPMTSAVHCANAVPAASPGSPAFPKKNDLGLPTPTPPSSDSLGGNTPKSPSAHRKPLGGFSLLFRGNRGKATSHQNSETSDSVHTSHGSGSTSTSRRGGTSTVAKAWSRLPNLLSPSNKSAKGKGDAAKTQQGPAASCS